jgi:NADH dehydrogenase
VHPLLKAYPFASSVGKPLTLKVQWRSMAKQRVLIVGGGFGGVKAALELCEDDRFDITLLSDRATFRYYPTLYHTATGGAARQSSIELNRIFANTNVSVTIGLADKLDREKKILITKDNKKHSYDVLILALGVVTNYFGIKGLKKYTYGIKSVEDAQELKRHLHQQLINNREPDLNYVVVGGGPTGIELSSALPSYIKHIMQDHGIKRRAVHVDLIEAAPRLLPNMPKKVSRIVRRRLRRLGVKLYLGQSVDQYLQASPAVYVLGDNAYTKYSGMAQTALFDSKFVVKNLKRLADGKKPKAYKAAKPVTVIPVGPKFAIVLWGKLEFFGWLGWVLRELADFVAFHDLEKLLPATRQWLSEFVEEDECPTCSKSELPGKA